MGLGGGGSRGPPQVLWADGGEGIRRRRGAVTTHTARLLFQGSLQATVTRHFTPGLPGHSGYSPHSGRPGVKRTATQTGLVNGGRPPGPPSSGGRSLRSHVGATRFALTSRTSEGVRGAPSSLARVRWRWRRRAEAAHKARAILRLLPLPPEPRHNACRPSPALEQAGLLRACRRPVLKSNFRLPQGREGAAVSHRARASGPSPSTSHTGAALPTRAQDPAQARPQVLCALASWPRGWTAH